MCMQSYVPMSVGACKGQRHWAPGLELQAVVVGPGNPTQVPALNCRATPLAQ